MLFTSKTTTSLSR